MLEILYIPWLMNSWSTKGGVSSDKETILNANESACAFAESSIKSGFATVKKHANTELDE